METPLFFAQTDFIVSAAAVSCIRSTAFVKLWLQEVGYFLRKPAFSLIFRGFGVLASSRSTQFCIRSGSLNRVQASAEVKAEKSPLPGSR